MIWIVKHKNGFQFEKTFSNYETADLWLRTTVLKGYDSIRDNYFVQTLD